MNLVASVANNTENKWSDYAGRYFYKKDENGENPLMKRLLARRESYCTLDPFDRSNHKRIMSLYEGSDKHYNQAMTAAKKMAEENDREVDDLDAYRALVWAISVWRYNALWDEKEEFIEIMNIKEGNHRVGAAIIMLFNAAYEPRDGKIICDTLKKDWFVRQLVAYDKNSRNLEDIDAAYANVDIRAEVLKLVQNPQSVLRLNRMGVVVFCGKTDDIYHEHGVDMDYIQNLDILFSRTVSDDKKRSVEPTENTTIAANIKAVLNLMEKNEAMLPEGETVNFSANASVNGLHYVGYERDAKNGKTPQPCELFQSPQWFALRNRPCPETIKEYYDSITIGSVILGQPLGKEGTNVGRKVPRPSHHTYHPPFPLDQDNMFLKLGVEGSGKTSNKCKPGESKAETYAQRRIDEGQSSQPITMSEHLRAVVVALTAASGKRALTNTGRHKWKNYTQREHCELAIQYIVDSQNFEMLASKWGNKIHGKSWDGVPWKELYGAGQVTKPDNAYIAFACMIADLLVSCFSNYKKDGLAKARAFVEMLATAHDDSDNYDDMAMVESLGEIEWDKPSLTNSLTQTNSTDMPFQDCYTSGCDTTLK